MRLTKRCCLPRAGPHATLRYHNACRHKPWPSMAQVERNLAAFGAVPTGQAAAAASTADAKAGGAGSAPQAAAASAAAVEGGGGGEDSPSLQAGEEQEPDDPSLPPKPALPDGSRWRCVRKEEQTLSLLLKVCVFLDLPGQSILLLMFVPSLSWQLILFTHKQLTRVPFVALRALQNGLGRQPVALVLLERRHRAGQVRSLPFCSIDCLTRQVGDERKR